MFPAPHGAVCAALLPHAMDVNIRALRARAPENLTRYHEIARLLTGRPHATAPDGVAWIATSAGNWRFRRCARTVSHRAISPSCRKKAAQSSSMKGNPIVLNEEELREIVSRSYEFRSHQTGPIVVKVERKLLSHFAAPAANRKPICAGTN